MIKEGIFHAHPGLTPAISDLISQVGMYFPVDKIYLYGSRARGTHQRHSDFDFAIQATKMTRTQWLHLTQYIDSAPVLARIDCVHLEKLKEPFLQDIMKDAVVIYEN